MNKYIEYFKYVVRHKWFVAQECFKNGLYWRGIMHDMSKFRPSEFFPYAEYFYGDKKEQHNSMIKSCEHCKYHTDVGNMCILAGSGMGNGDYGEDCEQFESVPYIKPTTTDDIKFDQAWLSHIRKNRHHWQWHILMEDCGNVKVMDMPMDDIMEMICDWVGAGKAQGKVSPSNDPYYETRKWYEANKDKITLSENTRKWVEVIIKYVDKIEMLFTSGPFTISKKDLDQAKPGTIIKVKK